MRTFQVDASFFLPLEQALVESFFPSVFGWKPSDAALRHRCALPTRKGGLGIPEICQLADEEAGASEELTSKLSAAILDQDSEFVEDLRATRTRRQARLRERDTIFDTRADELAEGLSGRAARGFEEARLRHTCQIFLNYPPAVRNSKNQNTVRSSVLRKIPGKVGSL